MIVESFQRDFLPKDWALTEEKYSLTQYLLLFMSVTKEMPRDMVLHSQMGLSFQESS